MQGTDENETRQGAESKRAVLVFIACVVIGTILRATVLNRFPFEQDELYTEIEARLLLSSPLNPGIEARPLYYLLQHLVLELAPLSHVSMRILPLIFGVAGIVVTWLLARRVGGTMAASVATVLTTFAPWHLYVSSMARYWSLVFLLSAGFSLLLFEAYRTDRRSHYLGALAALMLGSASHPTFLFAAAGAALGLSLVNREGEFGIRVPGRRAWTHLWIPFLVLLSAALIALRLTDTVGSLRNWSGRGLLATVRLIPAIAESATPTIITAGAIGAVLCLVQRAQVRLRMWGAMAVGAALATLGLLVAASLGTDVYADYAVSILPMILVSAGCLVQLGADQARGRRALIATVATALLVVSMLPATASFLSDGNRFDYRSAYQAIRAEAPSLPVLSAPIVLQRHYAPDLRGVELRFERDYLDRTLNDAGDVWVIIPQRRGGIWLDSQSDVAAFLSQRCRLTQSHERPRFDYRLYRTELYRCTRGARS